MKHTILFTSFYRYCSNILPCIPIFVFSREGFLMLINSFLLWVLSCSRSNKSGLLFHFSFSGFIFCASSFSVIQFLNSKWRADWLWNPFYFDFMKSLHHIQEKCTLEGFETTTFSVKSPFHRILHWNIVLCWNWNRRAEKLVIVMFS